MPGLTDYAFTDLRILIFTRIPQLGQVKTRLAAVMGEPRALALHRSLLRRTVRMACNATLAPVQIWVTGTGTLGADVPSDLAITVHQQQGEDLGERMHHALTAALESAAGAVIIGTDCPGLDAGYLRDALTLLDQGEELVLGPAADGGYVLIGLRAPEAQLFRGVAWGTDAVLAQTLERALALGLHPQRLPTRVDIDEVADLPLLAGLDPPLDD